MHRLKNDEMIIRTQDREVEKLKNQIAWQHKRTIKIVLGVGLIIIAFIALPDPQQLSSMPLIGWLAFAGGMLMLLLAKMSKLDRRNNYSRNK